MTNLTEGEEKELDARLITLRNAVHDRDKMVAPEDRVEAIETVENAHESIKLFISTIKSKAVEEERERILARFKEEFDRYHKKVEPAPTPLLTMILELRNHNN